MLWGSCLFSLSHVCGVNYRETSSEELGGISGRKGKGLGKQNGKETPGSLKTLKPCREFAWPKSYLALIDTTAKSFSALCLSTCSDGVIFFAMLLTFNCSLRQQRRLVTS